MDGGGNGVLVEKMYNFGMCGLQAALMAKFFFASRGTGAADSRPLPRGRHGVASVSIELEKTPALFKTRQCKPFSLPVPKMLFLRWLSWAEMGSVDVSGWGQR
jgi:hypothetical protein